MSVITYILESLPMGNPVKAQVESMLAQELRLLTEKAIGKDIEAYAKEKFESIIAEAKNAS